MQFAVLAAAKRPRSLVRLSIILPLCLRSSSLPLFSGCGHSLLEVPELLLVEVALYSSELLAGEQHPAHDPREPADHRDTCATDAAPLDELRVLMLQLQR